VISIFEIEGDFILGEYRLERKQPKEKYLKNSKKLEKKKNLINVHLLIKTLRISHH
jgi:hypothetical protein